MQLLVEVESHQAAFLLELLNSLNFVHTRQLSAADAEILVDLSQAVDEMKEIKAGQKSAMPLKDFLDEL